MLQFSLRADHLFLAYLLLAIMNIPSSMLIRGWKSGIDVSRLAFNKSIHKRILACPSSPASMRKQYISAITSASLTPDVLDSSVTDQDLRGKISAALKPRILFVLGGLKLKMSDFFVTTSFLNRTRRGKGHTMHQNLSKIRN
jgi:hypothetical protein